MATFFGEVNALSSRAVDDEEIDDQPTYNLTLDYKSNADSISHCKLLIFSVGDLAIAFTKCYLLLDSSRHLFDVKYSSNKTETESNMYTGGLLPSKGLKAASVYEVSSDVIICEIPALIPDEINQEISIMLLEKVNCQEALVLTSRHMANYKSEESLQSEIPFLKSLATFKYLSLHTPTIPRLQSPNFVSGFPAAVLTEFHIKKKSALCIISYVDSGLLDSLNAQTFESVRDIDSNVNLKFAADAKEKLVKYIKARHSIESNLYT